MQEAIRRKHKAVALLKEQIYLAEKRIDGTYEALSKEEQLLHSGLESRINSEINPEAGYDPGKESSEFIFEDNYEDSVNRIYGNKDAESILYSHLPGYDGPSPKKMNEKNENHSLNKI